MSVFEHYNATFDPIDVIRRYAAADPVPDPAYYTNYLGVKIDPKFHPDILGDKAGLVEGPPLPANWHADIAEWGAALRAVDLAEAGFTVVELGCAWGCWLNITGAAARSRGLALALCGVEAERGYLDFARESLDTNAFPADQVHLTLGIAAAGRGQALFPRRAEGEAHFGLEPIFDASPEQVAAAQAQGSHDVLETIPLSDLTPGDRIDLLHIDIQGGELDFVRSCLAQLRERVAYIVIGTHSREIEGELFQLLLAEGCWLLEMERPAIVDLGTGRPVVTVDGVQGWRNRDLLPL